MRYTEVRLTRLAHEMLDDLDKETVDFAANYDETLTEPSVLPAKIPNLLVNGSSGIAVGMATNVPPHNLGEVVDALAFMIDRYDRLDEVSVEDLMQFVQGPDFPTGGIILGWEGIKSAYATGHGKLVVRAKVRAGDTSGSGRGRIVINELPYQTNKAALVERIAELIKDKKISGIQ